MISYQGKWFLRQRNSRIKSFSARRLLLLISLFFKKHDTCLIFKANIYTFLYCIPALVCKCGRHGGLMVSALVRALARDIVLCSWARHLTLTVPLSTQVYKWVPVNCFGNLANCGGMTCDRIASCPVAVILPGG